MNKRYSEGQIIKAMKAHEVGAKVDNLCRRLGIACAHLQRAPQVRRTGS